MTNIRAWDNNDHRPKHTNCITLNDNNNKKDKWMTIADHSFVDPTKLVMRSQSTLDIRVRPSNLLPVNWMFVRWLRYRRSAGWSYDNIKKWSEHDIGYLSPLFDVFFFIFSLLLFTTCHKNPASFSTMYWTATTTATSHQLEPKTKPIDLSRRYLFTSFVSYLYQMGR